MAEDAVGVVIIETLVRRAEILRQINSNQAFHFERLSKGLSIVTIALTSAVSFVAFSGTERIHVLLAGWFPAIRAISVEMAFNVLTLGLVVVAILSLIYRFGERALRHEEAIRRLTEFIGPSQDLAVLARVGGASVSTADAQRIRQEYLRVVAAIPPSTDKLYKKARDGYDAKHGKRTLRASQVEGDIGLTAQLEGLIRLSSGAMAALRAVQSVAAGRELWLCGGVIRTLVWDARHGRSDTDLRTDDYDIVYFDEKDISTEADNRIAAKLRLVLPQLLWDVRNQARTSKDGQPVPSSLRRALRQFPETCSSVAVRLVGDTMEVACPHGLDDLFTLVVRPTSEGIAPRMLERLEQKSWLERWPSLRVSLSPDGGVKAPVAER